MDGHFPKRKLELEVADRISGAVSASNSKLFRFPSPICIPLRMRDSLLFPATFLETVLCGARGRAFSVAGFPVRDKRRWYGDESKRDIGSCDSRKPLAVGAPGSFTERLRTESARIPHPLPAGGLGLRSAARPHCWRRGCVSGGPVPGRELLGLPLAPRVPTLFLSVSIFPQRTYSRSAYSCASPQARSGLPAGGQPPTESLPRPAAERQGAFPAALRASSPGGPPGRGAAAGAALGAGARSPGAGGSARSCSGSN